MAIAKDMAAKCDDAVKEASAQIGGDYECNEGQIAAIVDRVLHDNEAEILAAVAADVRSAMKSKPFVGAVEAPK